MSAGERDDYARKAANLLALVGKPAISEPVRAATSPAAEPSLALALNGPIAAGRGGRTALANIPGIDAQRSLADATLDPSRDGEARRSIAAHLVRNIARFGPRLDKVQERRLAESLALESDPTLRESLAAVVGALKARPDASATPLPTYRASAAP